MCTEQHLLFKASPSDLLIINCHMALALRASFCASQTPSFLHWVRFELMATLCRAQEVQSRNTEHAAGSEQRRHNLLHTAQQHWWSAGAAEHSDALCVIRL